MNASRATPPPPSTACCSSPKPVYHRLPSGAVTGIGAITWARLTTTSGRLAWPVFGWSDRDDAHSPAEADARARLATLTPP